MRRRRPLHTRPRRGAARSMAGPCCDRFRSQQGCAAAGPAPPPRTPHRRRSHRLRPGQRSRGTADRGLVHCGDASTRQRRGARRRRDALRAHQRLRDDLPAYGRSDRPLLPPRQEARQPQRGDGDHRGVRRVQCAHVARHDRQTRRCRRAPERSEAAAVPSCRRSSSGAHGRIPPGLEQCEPCSGAGAAFGERTVDLGGVHPVHRRSPRSSVRRPSAPAPAARPVSDHRVPRSYDRRRRVPGRGRPGRSGGAPRRRSRAPDAAPRADAQPAT